MAITMDSPDEIDFSTDYLTAKEKQLNEATMQRGEDKPAVHASAKPEGWLKKLLGKIKSPERA